MSNKFQNKYLKDEKKKKGNVSGTVHYTGEYRGTVSSICNLKCKVPKKISIVFLNLRLLFYYKIVSRGIKKQFTCLWENTKKITFTVPVEIEFTKNDKNGEKFTKYISYILQFIDSARLWEANYEILPQYFLMEVVEINVNAGMTIKNTRVVELVISIMTVSLNTQILKMI